MFSTPPPPRKYGNLAFEQFWTQQQIRKPAPLQKNGMGLWNFMGFGLRNNHQQAYCGSESNQQEVFFHRGV